VYLNINTRNEGTSYLVVDNDTKQEYSATDETKSPVNRKFCHGDDIPHFPLEPARRNLWTKLVANSPSSKF